jgi:hypothetical protein
MPFKPTRRAFVTVAAITGAAALAITVRAWPQQTPGRGQPQPPTPTLGLEHGTIDLDTPDFRLKLVRDSQTIAALEPKGAKGMDANAPFDFTPADQLTARQGDRFNHLGDITLRIRQTGWRDGVWVDMASSDARKPVGPYETHPGEVAGVLAAADLTATLPEGTPLLVRRVWRLDGSGRLVLHFELRNRTTAPVEIGGLGFPLVFNNMIQNFVTNRARTLPQAHEIC